MSSYKLDVDLLRRVLVADVEAGTMTWLERGEDLIPLARVRKGWNAKYAGQPAMTHVDAGYYTGSLFGKRYAAHRVLWALHTGSWPEAAIDHINGDGLDNRIVNLRSVSAAENCRNAKLNAQNTSGAMGIDKRKGMWRARINVDGDLAQLGTYETFAEAFAARKAAEMVLGYHPNHGRPATTSTIG